MRRFLLFLAVLFTCVSASAQLNVKGASTSPESLATAPSSRAGLAFHGDRGYFMMLLSSNRFDKAALFKLGDSRDEAVKTLEDLRGLCGSIGDQVLTVEAWEGKTCTIAAAERSGWISVKFKQHAGFCELRDKDIDKFIKVLQEGRE